MGKVTKVSSFAELRRKLTADLRRKERDVDRALGRAAKLHADYLRKEIPVAFGELRASVQVVGTRVVVDAPHAAAVERGSRPHWVPLEALLAWVRLRGFQGLASPKALKRLPGTTTAGHAQSVRASLDAHNDESGYADTGGGASDVEGPMAVAKAIQISIALHGTKPQWYMRDSIPVAQGFVRAELHNAFSRDG